MQNKMEIKEFSQEEEHLLKNMLNTDSEDLVFFNIQKISEYFQDPNFRIFIATIEDIVVGLISFKINVDTIDIQYIYIPEEQRRKNIASDILEYLINYSKETNISEIFLEVNVKNKPAIALYEKFKFKYLNIRKNYYYIKDTNSYEDAYVYNLILK